MIAQRLHFIKQTFAVHFAVEHHPCSAGFDQLFGVASLMIVGGEGQRDENGG